VLTTGHNKKKIACTDAAERQQADKKNNLRAQQRKWPVSKKKKKMLRALQSGLDWTKERDAARPAGCDRIKKNLHARPPTEWKRPVNKEKDAARLKRLQLTDLRGQACADRPVRDRFNRSTMPVQPVLTRMVLVKSG
jgi:hypothetical protein